MLQPPEHEIEVFNIALELPAQERAAYLDEACAGDTALRLRIEELLNPTSATGAGIKISGVILLGF
jgi:serine/threonine-protein kinase